ncbi:MAG: hypothetical protein NT077_02585 [Candidatus Taylorbacteria bacterium]|nr:hypothetical protein [Candidatus Taylorbacteria bacterium]
MSADSKKTEEKKEKRNWTPSVWVSIIGVIVIIMLVSMFSSPSPERKRDTVDGPRDSAATTQPPAPAPDPVYYGTFTIYDERKPVEEIEVPAGMSITYSPVENLAYIVFTDGRKQDDYPVKVSGVTPRPVANIPYKRRVGFRLSSGQGRDKRNTPAKVVRQGSHGGRARRMILLN